MAPTWRAFVFLVVIFSVASMYSAQAQPTGNVIIASDLELLSLGDISGGGRLTWTLTGQQATVLRMKLLQMFDEQMTMPRGFPYALQATGATPGTVNNGVVDSNEAGQFLNYVENELEGQLRGSGGTDFRFVLITRTDRIEPDRPAEFSTSGIVDTTAATNQNMEIQFIFNAESRAREREFQQADEAFANALHAVFAFEATEDLGGAGCPPGCYPFPAINGWRVVGPPPAGTYNWTAGEFLWHGNVGASAWNDTGAYPTNATNATWYSPTGLVEGTVDLRFATNATFSFEHTGMAAPGDVLVVQLSEDQVTWTNLTAANDGDGLPPVDSLDVATLGTSSYDLKPWLDRRIYLRVNFTANGDATTGGPGYFVRNLKIDAPSRFEGTIDFRHIDYVVGFLSFASFSSPEVGPHLIRTPLGEVMFYNAAYSAEALPRDTARYATFDIMENPQILFVLLLVSARLLGFFQDRVYDGFRRKHSRSIRALATRTRWLVWVRRILILLMVLFYFFPTLLGAGVVFGGAAFWSLSIGSIVGLTVFTMFWYRRRAALIPPEPVREPREFPAPQLPPPPPPIPMDIDRAPQKPMVTVKCPACGEVQFVEEGVNLALTSCATCGVVLKKIARGYNYLVIAEEPQVAYDWFKNVLREGAVGLCMSTTFPEKVRREHGLPDVELYWLSDTNPGSRTLDPRRLDFEIMRALSNFVKGHRGSALVLDGLEYLIVENSFDRVLKFIKKVNDLASVHDATLFVPITPTGLGPEEGTLLRKEFDRVETIS